MSEDLISLLIYVALGLVGVIASAYKNKMKKQQQSSARPGVPREHTSIPSPPAKDYGPELGPLMELFEIPKPKAQEEYEYEYETIEGGPSVEEAGMSVDTQEASAELAGMQSARSDNTLDKQVSEVESFEEGQSEIQQMIARYEAVRKEMENDVFGDDIAKGEIVSVEAEEAAEVKRQERREVFDARKAIIYSEILKRREI